MSETIDLGDNWVADRVPWEALERLIIQLFPDLPNDGGKASAFQNDVRAELMRRGSAYWLGKARNVSPNDLLKLKRCDEAARKCRFRLSE